jgi:hypothetical protein
MALLYSTPHYKIASIVRKGIIYTISILDILLHLMIREMWYLMFLRIDEKVEICLLYVILLCLLRQITKAWLCIIL